MTPYLDDGDVHLYHGDALDLAQTMPDCSVDCIVTSPPYWGLRDYGTGRWEGGDPNCEHSRQSATSRKSSTLAGSSATQGGIYAWRGTCGRCGAIRADDQIGLEDSPDEWVERLVAVFRECRRVLAPHGTFWLNVGDAYAGSWGAQGRTGQLSGSVISARQIAAAARTGTIPQGSDLKPKDLLGLPWLLAFALRADGWWLRSEVIWAKSNPMPESVTDRPTKSHEQVFLLTKQPRYWYDADAIREPHTSDAVVVPWRDREYDQSFLPHKQANGSKGRPSGVAGFGEGGRNARTVWTIPTEPFPEAHFATYPKELVRRCIAAGCPARVCRTCGRPSERIVETEKVATPRNATSYADAHGADGRDALRASLRVTTVGWTDCGHGAYRPGVVLDPFMGSGTTALVARKIDRHAVGIELNAEYLDIAAKRLQQLSLLGPVTS